MLATLARRESGVRPVKCTGLSPIFPASVVSWTDCWALYPSAGTIGEKICLQPFAISEKTMLIWM